MLMEFGTNNFKKRANTMNKILACLVAVLLSFSAVADQHSAVEAEVRDAVKSYNGAYGGNKVEAYFSHFADDADLYWYGARQQLSAYHEEWSALVEGGGGVEKNELSDIQVRVLPGGNAAVATYFIDYRLRAPDGEVTETQAFETDVWQKIDGAWKVVSAHYTEIAPE